MRTKLIALALVGVASLVVLGHAAVAQQDKYALTLGKLSFGDFRGCSSQSLVSILSPMMM